MPTPRAGDRAPGDPENPRTTTRLEGAVATLPTPRATDGDKGGPNQRGSKGDRMLPTAEMLPTPKAGDADFGLPRTSGRPPEMSTHLATRLHYTDFGQYAPAIQRWERIIGRLAPPPTEPTGRNGEPRLSPYFVEWMMGLEEGWVSDLLDETKAPPECLLTRNDALRLFGNGVVPQQAETSIRYLLYLWSALEVCAA